ncbi:MAG: ribbon-helix-helix protein, CopG family [Monoglobales bacterium]
MKRILINLPEKLLNEVDDLVLCEKSNRSRIIQRAVRHYLKEHKTIQLKEQMKNGYREMAEINLKLAEIYFPTDCFEAECHEGNLAECD